MENAPLKPAGLGWTLMRWMVLLVFAPWLLIGLVYVLWPANGPQFRVVWVVVPVFLASRNTIRATGKVVSTWSGAILPAGICVALSVASTVLGREVLRQTSSQKVFLAFVLISVAFLLFLLAWFTIFPYEKGTTAWADKPYRWKIVRGIAATILSVSIVFHAWRLWHILDGATGYIQIVVLQAWLMQQGAIFFAVFILMTGAPRAIGDILETTRKSQSERAMSQ